LLLIVLYLLHLTCKKLYKMKKGNLVPIGNNIRLWRILKGFKQMEFAKKLDISKSTISKIENDNQEVGAKRLQQMAHILKINVTQLFVDPSSLLPPPPRIIFNRFKSKIA
jgi:transcriptional regulator with XRE-family HTH domain